MYAFLILLVVLIITTPVIVLLSNKSFEKYSRGFPPIMLKSLANYYRVVTPLRPLISPIKTFKIERELPGIYIYNPKYFSPVRDQGRCGACWGFVICGMLSDNVTIKQLKFGKNLNVQQLISCYPEVSPCDGAVPEDVLLWMDKTDFKLTIDNKYLQKPSQCELNKVGISLENNSVRSLCKYIKRDCIKNPTSEELELIKENINRMKMQLLEFGPFFGSIGVYQDFFNFKGDRVYVKESDVFVGGHAIEIVGWCDKGVDLRENFKDGYWVCKNSWSKDWATGYDFAGYFAIKMGSNECGIEARSGAAETNVDYVLEDKKIPEYFVYNTYEQLVKYIVGKRKPKF